MFCLLKDKQPKIQIKDIFSLYYKQICHSKGVSSSMPTANRIHPRNSIPVLKKWSSQLSINGLLLFALYLSFLGLLGDMHIIKLVVLD